MIPSLFCGKRSRHGWPHSPFELNARARADVCQAMRLSKLSGAGAGTRGDMLVLGAHAIARRFIHRVSDSFDSVCGVKRAPFCPLNCASASFDRLCNNVFRPLISTAQGELKLGVLRPAPSVSYRKVKLALDESPFSCILIDM